MPIHISNWTSLKAFLDCETQWRASAGFAGLIWVGLDYSACALRLGRRWRDRGLRRDLGVIEDAALEVLNRGEE